VLSGPEPQRTFFEALVLEQIKDLELKTIIVQGKTGSKIQEAIDENIKLISYATSGELNEMMSAAKLILCRSGYSSLMDLASLGKKAILVPTPGQTEQEYLAEYLFEQNIFYYQDQQDLNLEEALPQAVLFKGFQSDFEQNNFHIL
jgi:UDP-N-acetylglucosamine:LPS N-acetylglucosamine transferase